MITWVLYDISDDKARRRAVKYCKQAGLYRVQYSVFLGNLEPNRKDSLELQLEQEIDLDHDKVYIFPMNNKQLKETTLLGQAFDKKLISDEIKALFF